MVRSTATKEAVRRYIRMIPLKIGQQAIGVLCLFMEDDPRLIALEKSLGMERERSNSQTAFFCTFVDQATAVIERARLRRESLQIELFQRTDALRAALLSSVSHNLHPPLSSIPPPATTLFQHEPPLH